MNAVSQFFILIIVEVTLILINMNVRNIFCSLGGKFLLSSFFLFCHFRNIILVTTLTKTTEISKEYDMAKKMSKTLVDKGLLGIELCFHSVLTGIVGKGKVQSGAGHN